MIESAGPVINKESQGPKLPSKGNNEILDDDNNDDDEVEDGEGGGKGGDK